MTGRVDHELLDRLAACLAGQPDLPGVGSSADPGLHDHPGLPGWGGSGVGGRPGLPGLSDPGTGSIGQTPAAYRAQAAGRRLILTAAVDLLSGPGGLASWLRTGKLTGPAASVSLPLDLGTPTEVIPPHLRRAVIARDRNCAFPGCDQPPAASQVHHIQPRSRGGLTKLVNLLLLCSFHHLVAVHQWGWMIVLNADGTTTATSPEGARVLRSHSPPAAPAA